MANLVCALGDPNGVVEHRLGGVDLVRSLQCKLSLVSHAHYHIS